LTRKRLVLWDIDLTLIQVGPIGRELYAAAFHRATGQPMRWRAETVGRLDPDIFRDTIEAHSLDPAAHPFPRFAEALAEAYSSRSGELRERGHVLPGAAAALAALAGVPGSVQTVLTGNVPAVAIIKLATFDLDRYVDFEIGAYGPDGDVRADLVGVAQRRAGARHGVTFDAGSTVLVGDTPLDVAAGRDGGAFVLAVASGRATEADLRKAGADVVLPDLTDTVAVLQALATAPPPERLS
jgi:phosphoglycolate phosphatase-like HAD superfamily hydrolase